MTRNRTPIRSGQDDSLEISNDHYGNDIQVIRIPGIFTYIKGEKTNFMKRLCDVFFTISIFGVWVDTSTQPDYYKSYREVPPNLTS